MRKRKLYLSEFIARYRNNFDCKCKILYNYNTYDYESLESVLEYFKGNYEIETWTYYEAFGYIIKLK